MNCLPVQELACFSISKEICIGGSKEASMRVAATVKDTNGDNIIVLQDYHSHDADSDLSECII